MIPLLKLKAAVMSDSFTNTTAGVAVASYWWLPSLETVSQQAALWLPILGAGWLILQALVFVWKFFKGK